MRGLFTIYRRELAGLFFAPLGWVLLLIALFVNGFFFYALLLAYQGEVNRALQGAIGGGTLFWALLVFLPPLLTMRMLAEESRTGTLEFLLTAPVSDAAVVGGKFLAATTFMGILWTSVLGYALSIQVAGVTPDWSAVLCTWFGALLASGLFVSIGLLASSWTSTPILAAFLAFISCSMWLTLPMLAERIVRQVRSLLVEWAGGVDQAEAWMRGALDKMDVLKHFQVSFQVGVLDTAEVVFFITWPLFFLFLTVRSLEARRWRG
jgi:ABC-2 type transport system permease protein